MTVDKELGLNRCLQHELFLCTHCCPVVPDVNKEIGLSVAKCCLKQLLPLTLLGISCPSTIQRGLFTQRFPHLRM